MQQLLLGRQLLWSNLPQGMETVLGARQWLQEEELVVVVLLLAVMCHRTR
jgi:hypothetical protein